MHYILSERDDTPFWHDNRASESIPDELQHKLQLWRYRSPWHQDAEAVDELFPTASYQYILYGMGFRTEGRNTRSHRQSRPLASELLKKNASSRRSTSTGDTEQS